MRPVRHSAQHGIAECDSPGELDIVTPAATCIARLQLPATARLARGRVTLIEHVGGVALATVTWDHPGIPDCLPLSDVAALSPRSRQRY